MWHDHLTENSLVWFTSQLVNVSELVGNVRTHLKERGETKQTQNCQWNYRRD